MVSMEQMLKAHPTHPFALNHMGQLDAAEAGRLIKNYKNIYFLTAHTNPVIISHSNQPWVNMFDGATLAPEWRKLVLQHRDRFIFALDNVWAKHWKEFYLDQMRYWRKVMAGLPTEVAQMWAPATRSVSGKYHPRSISSYNSMVVSTVSSGNNSAALLNRCSQD